MPINNDLHDIQNPVTSRRGEAPSTKYIPHLENIKVELLDAPTIADLLKYIPRWGTATWNDKPHNDYDVPERYNILIDLFNGHILPSAMETINLIFLISNIDKVDVTHLLRHRTMSFSAVCSADRDLRHDDCMLKPSIELSPQFLHRYITLVNDAKQLYADMVDTDEISLLDARTVLPVSLEHHYYVRVNFKDALMFIRQRIDRQIQPESDNVVAMKMWIEICKEYSVAKNLIDVNAPDMWYVQTAPTGRSSNIYMPEFPRNNIFEYKKQWFLYKKQRGQMKGGEVFLTIWANLLQELDEI